ncbi:MAG: PHP domain-containing protein [Treponema sp.]|nr:PHP domain-containing protein [Treponema sp.]
MILSDFHIHSCLSPCGDLSMSPKTIAEILAKKGVKLAALTDHNSALNCPSFKAACVKYGIASLFGMEVQTSEEVHLLVLFSDLNVALDFGKNLYETLPPIMNNPDKMGDQVYVDEDENIIGEVEKYLVTSSSWSIDEVSSIVHALGGIVIPAHADRSAFSLTSQFGCIIDGDFDAIEVMRIPSSQNTLGYPLITSSDSHFIEHIARRPFELDIDEKELLTTDGEVNIEAVRKALMFRPR